MKQTFKDFRCNHVISSVATLSRPNVYNSFLLELPGLLLVCVKSTLVESTPIIGISYIGIDNEITFLVFSPIAMCNHKTNNNISSP